MKVLCVHPNFELYGSDRSFANAVEMLERILPGAEITTLLPQLGPIASHPPFDHLPVVTRDMFILRRRGLLRRLVFEIPRTLRALRAAIRDLNSHDLNYINTIIGVDFLMMARFTRRPVVIHVREIPNGIERILFRRLLIWSRATLIFNSEATRQAFSMPARTRTYVIHNGFQDPGPVEPISIAPGRPTRILTLGRLNHWKGQEILISAIGRLKETGRQVDVRIVGGTFNNQDDFRDRLVEQIDKLGLNNCVRIDPFEADPAESYRWADIVVVPSRLPEPFGRVAIEAMAFGRPVIASRHGGLVEIVKDGETGLLFPPSSDEDLARCITTLLDDPALMVRYGVAGKERFLKGFSTETFNKAFETAIQCELSPSR